MAEKYIEEVLFTGLLRPAALDVNATSARARWPSQCAACHGWGTKRICGDCRLRFAAGIPRCARCAHQAAEATRLCGACAVSPPPFEHRTAAVDYAYPWDRLMTRFPFHGALALAPALSQCLANAVARCEASQPSLLLRVPLSTPRLRERRYNQAWELARSLAPVLNCPADAHRLLRVRDTPRQLAFPPSQRAGKVRAAFAIKPRRSAELRARTVAIVDDAITTGATAAEIASVLLQAGAEQVQVCAVARTPQPGDA